MLNSWDAPSKSDPSISRRQQVLNSWDEASTSDPSISKRQQCSISETIGRHRVYASGRKSLAPKNRGGLKKGGVVDLAMSAVGYSVDGGIVSQKYRYGKFQCRGCDIEVTWGGYKQHAKLCEHAPTYKCPGCHEKGDGKCVGCTAKYTALIKNVPF